MRKFTFRTVVDCEKIFVCDDIVIFAGKHPWIFHKDGSYVAKLKEINRAYRMIFLPNRTVFMDGAGDKCFHYVSLSTGEVLWSVPKKGRRNLPPQLMALSPDGSKIYYLSCEGNGFGNEYVDTITLETRLHTITKMPLCKDPVCGFWCNADGTLSVLRQVVCSNDFRLLRLNSETMGILSYQEFKDVSLHSAAVASCDEYILFDDWNVYSMKTEKTFSLLKNEHMKIRRNHFVVDSYDSDRKLLAVHYLDHGSTVIVDCEERKIVSHYRPISNDLRGGCLIGDEFWIGSYDGITKRPFPNMDPFPQRLFENP